MEEISTSVNRLILIEFKVAIRGSCHRTLSPMNDTLGKFW